MIPNSSRHRFTFFSINLTPFIFYRFILSASGRICRISQIPIFFDAFIHFRALTYRNKIKLRASGFHGFLLFRGFPGASGAAFLPAQKYFSIPTLLPLFALRKPNFPQRKAILSAPAKGVGRETGARVRIPPSPPENRIAKPFVGHAVRFLFDKL